MMKLHKHSWQLIKYDLALLFVSMSALLMLVNVRVAKFGVREFLLYIAVWGIALFASRAELGIYSHIWRYGNAALYLRLMIADTLAGFLAHLYALGTHVPQVMYPSLMGIALFNLLLAMGMRLSYQYLLDNASRQSWKILQSRRLAKSLLNVDIKQDNTAKWQQRNAAIVGAGRLGADLMDELLKNPRATFQPCCFVEVDPEKIGRQINGIRIYAEEDMTAGLAESLSIDTFIFAISDMTVERRKAFYERYRAFGCKLAIYDYPSVEDFRKETRRLRAFDIEDLLFRKPRYIMESKTASYYKDKTILITGGGGSIGSELARQIAGMQPKKLVLLDIYENATYDIQQELKSSFGANLDLSVEILSICDMGQLDKAFQRIRPDIVFHAAAHKHVPLLEKNVVEAVKNNVFGTLNVANCCEKYEVEKAVMISTDKAVNPTSVMGATKRVCEMIFQSRGDSKTNFCCTRFGNVLGSRGSVVPLFRRQIEKGGPVTITDKRITRYFMTIPEACQLVLQAGALSKAGELYVLDMGQPVKILDLAEALIRLMGHEPYKDIDIVEIGLRPGEKLYEELHIQGEACEKTENDLIFIERDTPKTREELEEKLALLKTAINQNENNEAKEALKKAVPSFTGEGEAVE